jgi:hypothetical protein
VLKNAQFACMPASSLPLPRSIFDSVFDALASISGQVAGFMQCHLFCGN